MTGCDVIETIALPGCAFTAATCIFPCSVLSIGSRLCGSDIDSGNGGVPSLLSMLIIYWRSLGLLLSFAKLIVGIVSANERPPAIDVLSVVDWPSLMYRWLLTVGIVNEKGASELCEYGIVTMMSAFVFASYVVCGVDAVDDGGAAVGWMSSVSMKSSSSMPHNFITFAKSNFPVLVTGADCISPFAVACTVAVAFFFVAFDFFGFLAGLAGGAVTVGTVSTTGCPTIGCDNVNCDDDDDVVVELLCLHSADIDLFMNDSSCSGISCVCCDGIAISCDCGCSDCVTLIDVGCVVNWMFGPAVTTMSLVCCADGGGDWNAVPAAAAAAASC